VTRSAFKQLRESRDSFASNLERLTSGGELAASWVPPSPERVQPQLQALTQIWEKTDKNASRLLEMEKNLVSLGKEVALINDKNPQLLELSEQVAALKLQSSAGVREIAGRQPAGDADPANREKRQRAAARRCDRPGNRLPPGKDTNTFRDTIQALSKGSEALRIGADRPGYETEAQ
jgi:twitching motility protein PilJ